MNLDDLFNFVSRLMRGSNAHNTLNSQTVEIVFQKSPGKPGTDKRGIKDLDFQVVAGGVVVQIGRTGEDGKIQVQITGGKATLQLMSAGAAVAEYTITLRGDAAEDVSTLLGQQRRLRLLGYQLGPTGADQNGVDGAMNVRTDRSILNFQADNAIKFEGVVTAPTQTALTNQAGA
ncbi:MAG TPA: hypothetical protein VNZ64_09555 [Candidatus Acidoferrum sp.]|jgi:hypothetical protein|nr:hypothetical protein [Candidatus Acidoferrum sp.]